MIVTGWGGVDPIDTLLLVTAETTEDLHMTRKVCPPSIVEEKLPLILKILGPRVVFFFWDAFGRVEPLVDTHHLQKIKSRYAKSPYIF